ncbi:MAG TPA: universal stress protein [Methanobacteriaceae archaeon]|nr:universal stress protein [Methanobacteriaceae archaeon]
MYKKILLPTDGSEYAEKAGEHAIWIADKSISEIIVLNVVDTYYLKSLPQKDLKDELEKELDTEGNQAVQKFAKSLESSQCDGYCKNVILTTQIKEGKPADEILKTIEEEDIDLVVMGASGKNALNKFILGSVTERVTRSAKCAVLIVK